MRSNQKELFESISAENYETMKICLSAKEASFLPGENIYRFGEAAQAVGLLISGTASTVRYEPNGTRTILEALKTKDIFGELLSFQNATYESIQVVCDTACSILFFDYTHIIAPCSKVCPCHQQLIQNMLSIISEKAVLLGERIEVLTKRSIRGKLLCYFLRLSEKQSSQTIELPFNMVDLADYLCIDRSAMTRELKKMKDEGIVSIEKSLHHTRYTLFLTIPYTF